MVQQAFDRSSVQSDLGDLWFTTQINIALLVRRVLILLMWVGILVFFISLIFFIPDVTLMEEAPIFGIVTVVVSALVSLQYVYLIFNVFRLNPKLAVYEGGVTQVVEDQQETWLWDQFTGYEGEISYFREKTTRLTIMATNKYLFRVGEKATVTVPPGVSSAFDVAQVLINNISPKLAERHLDRINAGETIDYKKLQVRKEGVVLKDETIPWSEIEDISVDYPYLRFQVKGRRQKIMRNLSYVTSYQACLIVLKTLWEQSAR